MNKKYRICLIITLTVIALLVTSCSSVFTSSISGNLKNREEYDENPDNGDVANALVYLYLDAATRDASFNASAASGYYAATESDNNGAYTLNGIIWENLTPQFGKTADRKEVFLLIYHPDYGWVKNSHSIILSSDVSNSISTIFLTDILNQANIEGYVYDEVENEGAEPTGLQGVAVNVYIPTSWVNTNGVITDVIYPRDPDYTFTTDIDGMYEGEITFLHNPVGADLGKSEIMLTYELNNYEPKDSDIKNDKDLDFDGEATDFYLTANILKDKLNKLTDVTMAQIEENGTATLEGKILRWRGSTTNEQELMQGVTVDIYVADFWSYLDDNTIDPASIKYPKEPTYTLNSNNEGIYTQEVTYFIRNSRKDNKGTVPVAIRYELDGYKIDKNIDSDLGDSKIDINLDGVIDSKDDNLLYATLKQDQITTLPDLDIKQINFTTSLSGIILNPSSSDSDKGVSNKNITISFTTSNGDKSFSTVSETVSINNSIAEKGHYSFDNITWVDDTYTTDQSSLNLTISVEDITTLLTPTKSISSGKSNSFQIEIN